MNIELSISINKAKIQHHLKWTDEDYAVFQYEMGIAYLKHYLLNDEDSISHLEQCKFFWIWWRKRWADRDSEFVNNFQLIKCLTDDVIEYYNDLHNAKDLSLRIYPNKVIWKQALKTTICKQK